MTCAQQHTSDYALAVETPAMHASPAITRFIEAEVARPCKQWITHIIQGTQEQDEIVLRTDDFTLLPDTERMNRYWRTCRTPSQRPVRRVLNWLAIAHDRELRTMRDLRGQHVPLLRTLLSASLKTIERETGIRQEQVMAYVHYPPSVYQLHVHFSYPYGQYCHRDAYRVHGLPTIINNLEIDPDYYAKASLHMAVYRQSLHFAALAEAVPARLAFITEAQDVVPPARVEEDVVPARLAFIMEEEDVVPAARVEPEEDVVPARLAFIMEEEDVVPAARVEEDVPTHSQPTREPSPA